MSEKIAKENWEWVNGEWSWSFGSWKFECTHYDEYFQIFPEVDGETIYVSKKFRYERSKSQDDQRALNEAKVWAEEWAEEHIFKLGRERLVVKHGQNNNYEDSNKLEVISWVTPRMHYDENFQPTMSVGQTWGLTKGTDYGMVVGSKEELNFVESKLRDFRKG